MECINVKTVTNALRVSLSLSLVHPMLLIVL